MTTKELLYVEDTLGHAKYLQSQCKETAEKIEDPALRNFVEQMAAKHGECFQRFYQLLG